jgi:hypothetical protein
MAKVVKDKKTNCTCEDLTTMHGRRTNVPSAVLNIIQHTVCCIYIIYIYIERERDV